MMKFTDTIKHYDHSTVTSTKFLTLTEQAILKNHLKGVDYTLDGGYEDAEYKRAYINTEVRNITTFQIKHNKNFLTLSHQNILGSLLALNIERNVIGDILPEQGIFFVCTEIAPHIQNHFTEIGRHKITIQERQDVTIKKKQEYIFHQVFIDSLRLDLLVSRIANISRNEAKEWILNDYIKVNHIVTNKPTKELSENDIVSIRKKGRFVLIDASKRSKKNKIVLKYGKYN